MGLVPLGNKGGEGGFCSFWFFVKFLFEQSAPQPLSRASSTGPTAERLLSQGKADSFFRVFS